MGIQGLTSLLGDICPHVLKKHELPNYFGRKIAVDASMFLYSFLVAIRPDSQHMLTDETGETTSHLQGMFNRTIRLIKHGIKPVYVFDGKPPTLKSSEILKRKTAKKEAEEELKKAIEVGDEEAATKFAKRTVRVTPKQNEECKKLLKLMGVPVVQAPCEAEAQCVELVKSKQVYAVGTEDMDTLTLGAPILLRYLTYAEARKMPIVEIHVERVLEGLELTMDQFIDLCILCGCDYCSRIRGVGPKTAYSLIKKHGSLEKVVEALKEGGKHHIPDDYEKLYLGSRDLFKSPDITKSADLDLPLKWTKPDVEGLKQFLVIEKNFNETRVDNAIAKLSKAFTGPVQGRLDSFFSAAPSSGSNKRKAKPKAKGKGVKKARK